MKVFWGFTVGALCLIMLTTFNIDGMKMLADIGGFFSGFLMILFMMAACRIIKDPAGYDSHGEDYDREGRPIPSVRLPVEEGGREEKDPNES